MKLIVVGVGGHAYWHYQNLVKYYNTHECLSFHPIENKGKTSSIDDLLSSDAIFLASPTHTHGHYLNLLLTHNYKGALYIEKPAFDSHQGYQKLESYLQYNSKVFIGYHLPFTTGIASLIEYIKDRTNEIISINILTGSGIAYKNNFKNSWRSKHSTAVCLTGMSHIVSFLAEIWEVDEVNCPMVRKNKENGFYDTALICGYLGSVAINACYTWGGPHIFTYELYTTNSIVKLDENCLLISGPRDTFDQKGLFVTPPCTTREAHDDYSPKRCVEYFMRLVADNRDFPEDRLKRSLKVTAKCLKPYKKD